jgi:hypothetical protein
MSNDAPRTTPLADSLRCPWHPILLSALLLLALLPACTQSPTIREVGDAPTPTNWLSILAQSPRGDLTVRSVAEDGATLEGGFSQGLYSVGPDGNMATFVLIDGPIDNPRQAVTARMFWKPRAGRTPIDATATNSTIHYLIFTGESSEHLGIYSGAGFLYPHARPGGATLEAGMWQANLRLSDHTQAFDDLLGQAVLEGKFRVQRNDLETDRIVRRLNTLVRRKLGYPRLVGGDAGPADRLTALD